MCGIMSIVAFTQHEDFFSFCNNSVFRWLYNVDLDNNVTTHDSVDNNAILTLIDNATNSRSERIQLRRPLSTVVSPSEVPANVNGDEDDDGSSWQETHMVLMMVISFCSKQLKIHFHRFLIYPRHPT